MEIIPAIIPKSFNELQEKLKLVEPFFKTVQLDIMDGIFVNNETWPFIAPQGKPADLEKLKTDALLEAHLMVQSPQYVFEEWLKSPVGRITLHWEPLKDIHMHDMIPFNTQMDAAFPVSAFAVEARKRGKWLGIALNPETPIDILDNFINEIDLVLLMSVNPGFGGQPFQESVLNKIAALRKKHKDVKIEVDGGVNSQNAEKILAAGADYLVMGSAIFDSGDIPQTITNLKKINLIFPGEF